jgi:serine protease Do
VDGQVVGMNTAIYSPTGGSNGIGFAIPGAQVQLIENLLITKGKVVRSMIGLVPDDVKEYERTGNLVNGGARVVQVEPGPGQKAGILKDDVIVKIGSTRVTDQSDLRNAMLAYSPGSTVPVQFYRNGQLKSAQVTLDAYKLPKTPTPQRTSPGMGGNGSPFSFGPFNGNPFGPDPFGDRGGNGGNGGEENTPPIDHSGPAQLGVQVKDVDDEARTDFSIPTGVTGAVVVGVEPNSVAASFGIQPGDVVESFNGKTIATGQDLKTALKGITWGSIAHIKIVHFDGSNRLMKEEDVKFQ